MKRSEVYGEGNVSKIRNLGTKTAVKKTESVVGVSGNTMGVSETSGRKKTKESNPKDDEMKSDLFHSNCSKSSSPSSEDKDIHLTNKVSNIS